MGMPPVIPALLQLQLFAEHLNSFKGEDLLLHITGNDPPQVTRLKHDSKQTRVHKQTS